MMTFVFCAPVARGLTNEPESPDTAEIYYDAESGYFSCWGTDMAEAGRNYYIAPYPLNFIFSIEYLRLIEILRYAIRYTLYAIPLTIVGDTV